MRRVILLSALLIALPCLLGQSCAPSPVAPTTGTTPDPKPTVTPVTPTTPTTPVTPVTPTTPTTPTTPVAPTTPVVTVPPPSTDPPKPSELDRTWNFLLNQKNDSACFWADKLDNGNNLVNGYASIYYYLLSVGCSDHGWYQSFICFDLTGKPAVATRAEVKLLCTEWYNPTGFYADKVGGQWNVDTGSGSADPSAASKLLPQPENGQWYPVEITDWYNDWQTHAGANNFGFRLRSELLPTETALDAFCRFESDRTSKDVSYQPRLVVTTGTPMTKWTFPLTGRYHPARVTGYHFGDDCTADYQVAYGTVLKHTGIDLQASAGEEVRACKSGRVAYAKTDNTWGGYVVIVEEEAYTVTYEHIWPSVNAGDQVTAGQKIAIVAPATAYTPHLHLQVRRALFENPWSLRGRLPTVTSVVVDGGPLEPAWPERFINPEWLDWE